MRVRRMHTQRPPTGARAHAQVRNLFYDDAVHAMQSAVADKAGVDGQGRKMMLTITPPELNMEMDSYRVGSLLELVREAAIGFATHGLNVRVCVQGSMGQGAFTGVPRVLSGVRKLLQLMDWQVSAARPWQHICTHAYANIRCTMPHTPCPMRHAPCPVRMHPAGGAGGTARGVARHATELRPRR